MQECFSVALAPAGSHHALMDHWSSRLRERAAQKDLGPADLSRLTSLPLASIQKYFQGAVDQPRGRAIEVLATALGVNVAWLRDGIEPATEGDDESAGIAFGNVPEVDVRASAGGGAVVDREDEISRWGFPVSWVRNELNASLSELRVITIEGDSMISEPPSARDILPGDKAVVNVADRLPTPPGVFVVHDGLGLVAKRVEHIPNSDPPSIRISSNNRAYAPYERTLDEAHILGRIVGKWARL